MRKRSNDDAPLTNIASAVNPKLWVERRYNEDRPIEIIEVHLGKRALAMERASNLNVERTMHERMKITVA